MKQFLINDATIIETEDDANMHTSFEEVCAWKLENDNYETSEFVIKVVTLDDEGNDVSTNEYPTWLYESDGQVYASIDYVGQLMID